MKKIIAILLALAVVSMAFAQSVSVSNTLSTTPYIIIDGGFNNWGFNPVLSDKVEASGTTADGRASFAGTFVYNLNWVDRSGKNILSPKPRWKFGFSWSAIEAKLKPIENLDAYLGNRWGA